MKCPDCGRDTVNNINEKLRKKNPIDKESPVIINRHVRCEPIRGGCGADWWYEKEVPKIKTVKIDGKVYRDITEYSTTSTIKGSKRIHERMFPNKNMIMNQPVNLEDIK